MLQAGFDGSSLLRLHGELDAAMVSQVRPRLLAAAGDIELDCCGLTFVDAAGVNMFVELHQVCRARGARLTLVRPSPCLTRLLDLTGVAAFLDVRSGRAA